MRQRKYLPSEERYVSAEEYDWHERRADINFKQKAFRNEQSYSASLGGRSAVRITIPALTKKHLDSAVLHLSKLVDDLKAIQKEDTKIANRISLLRTSVYHCHTSLKRDADHSYLMPRHPSNDFRGAK